MSVPALTEFMASMMNVSLLNNPNIKVIKRVKNTLG